MQQHYTSNGTLIESFAPANPNTFATQNRMLTQPLQASSFSQALSNLQSESRAMVDAIQAMRDAPSAQAKQTHQAKLQTTAASIKRTLTDIRQQSQRIRNVANQRMNDPMTPDSSEEMAVRIANAQQTLNTTQHLAKQSHELYLRQRRLMWIWVTLCVVLAAGTAFFCFWLHGLRKPHQSDLIQNTPPVKEIFDNKAVQPSKYLGEDEEEEEEEDDFGLGEDDDHDEHEDAAHEDAPREDAPREDTAREDAAREDAAREDAAREDAAREDDDSSSS